MNPNEDIRGPESSGDPAAGKVMTMKALADLLGVSRTTVSLVLQGKGEQYRISRETRDKILRKAQELNFRPNYFASALNKGKTGVIGVVFPDVFESFMGRIARGIESVLCGRGSMMMLSTSRFDNRVEKQIVEQFLYRGVDGFLVIFAAPFSGWKFDYSHLEEICGRGIPMVFIDRYLDQIDVPRVSADDYGLARRGLERLISGGSRRIVCVSFDLDVSTLKARVAGYTDALSAGGQEPEYILLTRCDPEADDLADAIAGCVGPDLRPPDFFITTSGLADKTAWLLQRKGLVPGRDLEILRFGETPQWIDSGIIDIPQPHEEMGRRAADLLLGMIGREDLPDFDGI